jgi:hypothetical protein
MQTLASPSLYLYSFGFKSKDTKKSMF